MTEQLFRPRYGARPRVTGTAVYCEDIELPRMAYGAVLRSPYAHAQIREVDASRAKSLPGVLGVLTQADLEKEFGQVPVFGNQPVLATDKALYEGEPVAAVAAVNLQTAQQACELIAVEYEDLPAVLELSAALEAGAPIIHETQDSNICAEWSFERGDIADGFLQAEHQLEEVYTFPRRFHYPLECVGVCISEVNDDEIRLWAPAQNTFNARLKLARMFQSDLAKVQVKVPLVGAGFGSKYETGIEGIAALLSKQIGRAVKMMPSMEETFRMTAGAGFWIRLKTGVTSDGKINAQEIELLVEGGAYGGNGPHMTTRAYLATGPYDVPNLKIVARAVNTNKPPSLAYRGSAGQPMAWGHECHMDSLASLLEMDPLEFRQRNLLRRGAVFFQGTLPIDTDYKDLLRQAADAIGWRKDDLPPGRGRGLACTIRHGGTGTNSSEAMVILDASGRARVVMNAVEIGQGLHTMVAEVVARELGLSYDLIRIEDVDTANGLFFAGTSAARGTVAMGRAVLAAVADVKRELADLASKVFGGESQEWEVKGNTVVRPLQDTHLSLREVVGSLGAQGSIAGKGSFRTPRSDSPLGGVNPYWEVGIGAAEVEVDRETGEIRLLKYVAVADIGHALHRGICEGQVYGAAMLGLGNIFYEENIYRENQMMNGNSMDYRVPAFEDLPETFECILVENQDGAGPFGSKGIGETGILPTAPAIGNAVYNAVEVRIRDLPLAPEKVLRALGKL